MDASRRVRGRLCMAMGLSGGSMIPELMLDQFNSLIRQAVGIAFRASFLSNVAN